MRQGAADACRTSPMPPFNLDGSNARRHNFASTPSIREQVGFAVKSTRRQRDLLFADAEYHGHRRADDTDHQMTRSSEIDRQRNSRPNRYYQTNMGIRIPALRCEAVFVPTFFFGPDGNSPQLDEEAGIFLGRACRRHEAIFLHHGHESRVGVWWNGKVRERRARQSRIRSSRIR
jgi:hypothetical protein